MLTPDQITEAAGRLHEAEQTRTQIRQLTLEFPKITIDDAYAIQRTWVAVVLSGSFTRPMPVAAGDTIHADYGALGSISCRFV